MTSKNLKNAKALEDQRGFTLIEVLTVVAIIGILISIASVGWDILRRQNLSSATTELLADLQAVRLNAMTQSTGSNSRGFGLRFLTNGSYKVFEFVDNGTTAFTYQGTSEESGGYSNVLPDNITVSIGASGSPINLNSGVDEEVLLYDKRGITRTYNWSSFGSRTYVLHHSNLAQAKCIAISTVRIREGRWDGSDCIEL